MGLPGAKRKSDTRTGAFLPCFEVKECNSHKSPRRELGPMTTDVWQGLGGKATKFRAGETKLLSW